ncbi:hypothetical protein PX699_27600 [Sphingobium sp. H39-3-25]|uniref:hypothetical protein n=1 Tax=Sphingobium arseniciresistens TaxID=3030834 RepID=UPI0023B9FB37|nr:hypothetical protein [Sphingobium arseniciresistens]
MSQALALILGSCRSRADMLQIMERFPRLLPLALYGAAALAAIVLLFLWVESALGDALPAALVTMMIALAFISLTQLGEGRR